LQRLKGQLKPLRGPKREREEDEEDLVASLLQGNEGKERNGMERKGNG